MKISIEISARHIHLSQVDADILFGKNYRLNSMKTISQPGQFATEEEIKIIGPKGAYEKVRIVGPIREDTQVELSITDCFHLGIKPKVLISGDIENSVGGLKIIVPAGEVKLKKGVLVAKRHLHISPSEAEELNLKHLDKISVKVEGERSVVFNNVVVRSREGIDKQAMHIDTDEANAAHVKPGDMVEIEKK